MLNSKIKAFKKITKDNFTMNKTGDDFGWITNQMPKFALKKLNMLEQPIYNVYDWRFLQQGEQSAQSRQITAPDMQHQQQAQPTEEITLKNGQSPNWCDYEYQQSSEFNQELNQCNREVLMYLRTQQQHAQPRDRGIPPLFETCPKKRDETPLGRLLSGELDLGLGQPSRQRQQSVNLLD